MVADLPRAFVLHPQPAPEELGATRPRRSVACPEDSASTSCRQYHFNAWRTLPTLTAEPTAIACAGATSTEKAQSVMAWVVARSYPPRLSSLP